MSTEIPEVMITTFRSLAEVVYAGDSFEEVSTSICLAATELVDGCDHASLMLRRRGRTTIVAASDTVARTVDELEIEIGEGPCLDALDDDQPNHHLCTDLSQGSAWPRLDRRVAASTPVRGLGGFRLRLEGGRVGALNVFSDVPGALNHRSLEQALMLSAFGQVAITALERGDEAATLGRGLESNREIGKAIGLLMAMHDIDDDAAFRMLSRVSQEMNIKVAEVASRIIAHHRGAPTAS